MRLRPLIVSLALGFACAAVIACGGDRSGLLPSGDAGRLQADLDALESAVSAGECGQVSAALQRLQNHLVQIPATVDRDLRERINEGAATLVRQAPEECRARAAEEEPTDTTTTQTTDTETQTTDTEPTTETEPTEPTAPTQTTEPTQPPPTTEPPATEPPPADGTGGAGAPPGGTP